MTTLEGGRDGSGSAASGGADGGSAGAAARAAAQPASLTQAPESAAEVARLGALGLGAVRVALGVLALAAPELAGRAWIGTGGAGRDRAVLARALGGRDIALGAGALLAATRSRRDVRRWVALGAAADSIDTLATAMGFAELPRRRRWLVLAASAGAAVSGVLTALSLPQEAAAPPAE